MTLKILADGQPLSGRGEHHFDAHAFQAQARANRCREEGRFVVEDVLTLAFLDHRVIVPTYVSPAGQIDRGTA